MTGSKTGNDMRDKEVNVLALGREAYVESPAAVIPGRASNRRDLSGGSATRLLSLKDGAGNEDRYRCWREGRRRNI